MLGEKTQQISTFGNETEMVDPVLPVALAIVDGAMRMKRPTTQSPLMYWEKHNGPRFLFCFTVGHASPSGSTEWARLKERSGLFDSFMALAL